MTDTATEDQFAVHEDERFLKSTLLHHIQIMIQYINLVESSLSNQYLEFVVLKDWINIPEWSHENCFGTRPNYASRPGDTSHLI
jgi:hypothetical protein